LANDKSEEVFAADVRNNDRVVTHNEEIADLLWSRVKGHIPDQFSHHADNAKAVGISSTIRFYRYLAHTPIFLSNRNHNNTDRSSTGTNIS
jgi:hypothetical protein